jgi:hypothetical protein
MNLVLSRVSKTNDQVVGLLNVVDKFNNSVCELKTVELPWLNNAIGKSCIPCGSYEVVKRWSIRYGHHFWLTSVTNRSMILIHSGNFFNQTRGCILVGIYLQDSNRDNNLDVCQSRNALEILDLLLPQSFNLKITEQWSI